MVLNDGGSSGEAAACGAAGLWLRAPMKRRERETDEVSRGKKSDDEGEGSKGSAGHSSARRGLAGAGRQGRGRQGGGATELLVAEELGHELLLGEDDGSEESRMCSARREAFSAGAEMGAIWRSWLPAAAARRKAGGAGRGGLGRLQGLGLLLPDRGREELRSGLAGHGRPSGVLVGETRWRDWLRGDFFGSGGSR